MARDKIHDAVKNALIKDGWQITHDPFGLEYKEISIFADLAAEKQPILVTKGAQKIIVEVKTFSERSFIRALQQALGQYSLYLDVIELGQLDYEFFLAINDIVYRQFFTREGVSQIIQRHQLKMFTVDIEQEEIVQWIK
ncbi:MAG: XisH protein [Ardenticatenaceae bacterium]|nr:XisH protein [Ardenticatenaceae bacterium]